MSGYFKDKEPKELKKRLFAANILVLIAFFALLVRFWYLQVKKSDYYRYLALNNATRLIKAAAPRGAIFDRLGVKLATSRPGFDLYVVPEDVKDWDSTKEALKRLADLDAETIDEKLRMSKGRPPFQAVKLKEDLSWEETVKIEGFKFQVPGILLDVSPKRSYIFSEPTAHLLGYIGEISERELGDQQNYGDYSPGDLIGRYGVEKSFEEDLRGVDGGKEVEVDALGRKIRVVNWTPPYPGNNIKLTIDIRTQTAAWAA
ncbi:MAG: penicillin-binding protein 2, partial [Deltaproteobacteria bacterium]|nr:penicillin-binding protein 2 [Deltaproteobacteria bacterium]